jgi:hypothetical protein
VSDVGQRTWAIARGHIPPTFGSYDKLCLLNAGDRDAVVELTIYFAEREPWGPYRIDVAARRVRHVKVADLIDPFPVPLDEPYGIVVQSDRPIVAELKSRDAASV